MAGGISDSAVSSWSVSLLHKFSPVFFFDSLETFFPCTVEFLFSFASLMYQEKSIHESAADVHSVLQTQHSVDKPQQLALNIWKSGRTGEWDNLDHVPVYGIYSELPDYYQLQYVVIYAYNGETRTCVGSFGAHQADVERVTVLVRKSDLVMARVFFAQHAHGVWHSGGDVHQEMQSTFGGGEKSMHPVIYVARHSHASYPTAGSWRRIFGLVTDEADGLGVHWRPMVEPITETTMWNRFLGFLGYPDHCRVPLQRSWWKNETQEASWRSTLRRWTGF